MKSKMLKKNRKKEIKKEQKEKRNRGWVKSNKEKSIGKLKTNQRNLC